MLESPVPARGGVGHWNTPDLLLKTEFLKPLPKIEPQSSWSYPVTFWLNSNTAKVWKMLVKYVAVCCRGQRMRGAIPPLPDTSSWRGA